MNEEIAFSRDGNYVATAGPDDTARIWDALTGQELFHFIQPRGVEAVAFSPDGRWLVTGSDDGRLRVFLLDVARARVTRWWTKDECREYLHGPCPDKTSTLALKFNSELQPTGIEVQTVRQVEEYLLEQEADGKPPVLVYKMHGTAWLRCGGALVDSVVVTENDYIDFFAQDQLNRIPSKILELLRTSRLLFLGYALEDWNFRVLLRRLQSVRRQGNDRLQRHWACLLNADPVEVRFWEKRGVNVYENSLEVVLTRLLQHMS